jgi:hypothetical protein
MAALARRHAQHVAHAELRAVSVAVARDRAQRNLGAKRLSLNVRTRQAVGAPFAKVWRAILFLVEGARLLELAGWLAGARRIAVEGADLAI